jgi:hypothetical protein
MSAKRIVTVTDPGCEVVVFSKPDGSAEAVVTHPLTPPTTIQIEKAPKGQRIVTTRFGDGTVEITYQD